MRECVYVVGEARSLGGSATALGGAGWMEAAMRLRARKSMCSSLPITCSKDMSFSIRLTSAAFGKWSPCLLKNMRIYCNYLIVNNFCSKLFHQTGVLWNATSSKWLTTFLEEATASIFHPEDGLTVVLRNSELRLPDCLALYFSRWQY